MTIVATFGATPVPSEAVAIPPKQHRNFRIEDDLWLALARVSELRNERTSDVMRDLVKGHVAKYRKLIADDPVLARRIVELREQRERKLAESESPATAVEQQERTS